MSNHRPGGPCGQKVGQHRSNQMFSKDIRMRALEVYSATGSISQTIQQMGNCFSHQTLYQ